MSASGSGSRTAPAAVAVAAVLAGTLAMPLGALAGSPLGLHGALVGGELALVVPAVVALFGLRRLLAPGAVAVGPLGGLHAVLALGAGIALWLASLGLVGLQQLVWPPPPGYLEAFARLHDALAPEGPASAAASLAAIAIAPAVCEELAFRGVAQPGLRPLLGRGGALVAASLLFGLIHIDMAPEGLTAWRVPFAIGVGLGLGSLRERSGRLLPSIVAHAGLNTLTWGLVALAGTAPEAAGPDAATAVGALVAGSVAFAFLLGRRWRVPAPGLRLP